MSDIVEIPLCDELAAACSRTGLLFPAAVNWIAPLIDEERFNGYEVIARAIRSYGEPVDTATKKALGVRGNAKLGTAYVAALTDAGRKRAMDAAFLIVQRAMQARFVRRELARFRESEGIVDGVEVVGVHDDRTCRSAKAQEGTVYPIDRVPVIPLPQCDADYCRCCYISRVHGFC